MRHHAGIRTAAVLAQIPADGSPVAIRDIAAALGARSSGEISGHMTHLHRSGQIRRVERGVWQRVMLSPSGYPVVRTATYEVTDAGRQALEKEVAS